MGPVYRTVFQGLAVFVVIWVSLCTVALAQGDKAVTIAVQQAKETGVGEEVLNQLLVLSYNYNLRPAHVAEFINMAGEAGAKNLPVQPLVSKMEEGLAKGVQVGIIKQVVRQELRQYNLVRELVYEAMNRWNLSIESLTEKDLVRLTKTMSMGISGEQMKGFFEQAQRASVKDLANALEFMAALKQSRLSSEATEQIVSAGLERGYFSKGAWGLALTVKAAKRIDIEEDRVRVEALEVVRGNKTVQQAQKALGIDPGDLDGGPQIMSPRGAAANIGEGAGGGEGGPAGEGHGFGGGNSGAGGDAGGAGSGGEGHGGGTGSGGAGSGEGSGGGQR